MSSPACTKRFGEGRELGVRINKEGMMNAEIF